MGRELEINYRPVKPITVYEFQTSFIKTPLSEYNSLKKGEKNERPDFGSR
ncbi:MAG: hypothetical protein ACHQ6U_01010 [Thermodesulfobacteriota bacterium]